MTTQTRPARVAIGRIGRRGTGEIGAPSMFATVDAMHLVEPRGLRGQCQQLAQPRAIRGDAHRVHHRHATARLNESHGAALTPPSRVVNAARTPGGRRQSNSQQRSCSVRGSVEIAAPSAPNNPVRSAGSGAS